jgi:hypothetical protein
MLLLPDFQQRRPGVAVYSLDLTLTVLHVSRARVGAEGDDACLIKDNNQSDRRNDARPGKGSRGLRASAPPFGDGRILIPRERFQWPGVLGVV